MEGRLVCVSEDYGMSGPDADRVVSLLQGMGAKLPPARVPVSEAVHEPPASTNRGPFF